MPRIKRTRPTETAASGEATPAASTAPSPRRIQAKRKKRSPSSSRDLDHSAEWTKLQNKDPDVKYVLASLENPTSGVRYYEDIGYEVILHEEGGVQFGAGANRPRYGEPMEMFGCVLMGIHKDDWDDIQEHGIDGQSGYQLHKELEERIIAPGGVDSLRGQMPDHLRVGNDTSDKYRSEEI
jgi:hypothetical protein